MLLIPGGTVVKNLPASGGEASSIPGSGGSPGEGNGNPLQGPCLEIPMDRGAWQATVHAVTQSQTQLKRLSRHTFIHMYFSQSREEGFYFLENSDNPRQKCNLRSGKKISKL